MSHFSTCSNYTCQFLLWTCWNSVDSKNGQSPYCFDLPISKRKLLKNFLLVTKVEISEKNFSLSLVLVICQQEKEAHTNNYADKDLGRKELITSCSNFS